MYELKTKMIALETLPCPEEIRSVLERYRDEAIPPDPFLCAVLGNDLKTAVAEAEPGQLELLPRIFHWIEEELPAESWGNKERVLLWLNVTEYRVRSRRLMEAAH